jgi:3-hydroxyisobutyrate dehydrogenase-like beta-hydroxyacid dehydrogenase
VTVAVLGLGEAGSRYAADLAAAGVPVSGYDPAGPREPLPPGLRLASTAAEAADGADLVLSVNAAAAAERAARDAAGGLRAGAVYADLNTSSPDSKRRVAAVLDGTGALFADVAVLAPVPRAGLRTPVALAGPGREKLARFLRPLGVPVEDAGPEPGTAAARKLLRSIFMKGLAAAVIESMDVAARAGLTGWLWDQITAELAAADSALATRLMAGTRQHAPRRLAEMRAAHDYATELGAPDPVTQAVIERLAALTAGAGSAAPPRLTRPGSPGPQPGR